MPSSRGRDIVVVGTSAGGVEALDELVGRLSPDIPASIFVVQHFAPEATAGALLDRLDRHKAFRCTIATDEEHFERGRIYIAPPDHHLLVKKTQVLVTKGNVGPAALSSFLSQGFTRQQALDVVLGVGLYTLSTYANRLTEATLDPPLEPFAWSKTG